jgi:hypothetical protein
VIVLFGVSLWEKLKAYVARIWKRRGRNVRSLAAYAGAPCPWVRVLEVMHHAAETLGLIWGEEIGQRVWQVIQKQMMGMWMEGARPPDRIEQTTAQVVAVWKYPGGQCVWSCDALGGITWITTIPAQERETDLPSEVR